MTLPEKWLKTARIANLRGRNILARLTIVVGQIFRMYLDNINCYKKRFGNISNAKGKGTFVITKLSAKCHFSTKIKTFRIGQ